MSKGSTPRRRQIERDEYERRWAETFGGESTQRAKTRIWRETLAGLEKPFREVADMGEALGIIPKWVGDEVHCGYCRGRFSRGALPDHVCVGGNHAALPQADGHPGDDYGRAMVSSDGTVRGSGRKWHRP